MANLIAPVQELLHHPADDAVAVVGRRKRRPGGLQASLLAANARVVLLKKKLSGAAERERRFLAAELHDDVQQILFGLFLGMGAAQAEAADRLPTDLLGEWMQTVQVAMDHLHELTVTLRKPAIEDPDWLGTLRCYIDKLPLGPKQKVLFETDAQGRLLPPEIAFACFRIVQEALGNAMKHSGARNLRVRINASADRLVVSIRDDGTGFDVNNAYARALDAGSIGLSSMRERAILAGGDFDVQSSSGHGTSIRASFPIGTVHQC